jgi:peptide/nickel transport system permease protein
MQYAIRRLLLNVIVLWVVVSLVFVATNALPGDYAVRQASSKMETQLEYEEAIRLARKALGLDKPLWQRYLSFMGNVARLDFGRSYETNQSTWQELGRRFPATLELGTLIALVAFSTSIPIGIISAVKQNTLVDYALRGFAVFGVASPVFFTALVLTLIVLKFRLWTIDIIGQPHFWNDPGRAAKLYVIPAVAGGISAGSGIMRILRSQMLEVLRNDYIRTAFAKGLRGRTVWVRHALKNAMLPVLTAMGFTISGIVGGQVILENMFNIDGIGRYLYSRLIERDLPPFQGAVILIASIVLTVNLLVDIAYAWLDPRVRYQFGSQ